MMWGSMVPTDSRVTGRASRRLRERRPVRLNGYLVLDGGVSQAVELVDLNYGGCGVQTQAALQPGDSVTLTVHGRGSIPAEVTWFGEGRAGLRFTPENEPEKQAIQRRVDRTSITADVNLRTLSRNNYRVRVLDLSTDGCKVELVERPSAGDYVSIKFEGLDTLEAEVSWVEGHMAGLKFKHRIHPAVLDLLLQRLSAT